MTSPPRLSKSRFMAGVQCTKQLWWRVQEPTAPELLPNDAQERTFARGHHVGEVARTYVPGGVLIDLPHDETVARMAATAKALADGAPVIYEASFLADGVFVSVDILERRRRGFGLIEVKSTLDVKEEHLPDVAIQLHVLRQAGLDVRRAEVMHLNRECRYPDLSTLFVRVPMTRRLRPWLREIPTRIPEFQRMLAGPVPAVATGPHCRSPYDCPFLERCWPALPDHHVSTLYRIRDTKIEKLVAEGYLTLFDLPPDFEAGGPAQRQIRSVQQGEMVIERGLRRALAKLRPPLAFLDFETINPAIPVWPGCRPYEPVPVQFSCHGIRTSGLVHSAWLADGLADPRRPLAEALLEACRGARTIVAYNASFERGCIEALAEALPDLAPPLRKLSGRMQDLLKIVRNHVYHPEFAGSFRLKSVLPALVPGLNYEDLEIRDGDTASAALEALLLEPQALREANPRELREALLRYCGRDTLGLVRLYQCLMNLPPGSGAGGRPGAPC
jgi:hypothetical protein